MVSELVLLLFELCGFGLVDFFNFCGFLAETGDLTAKNTVLLLELADISIPGGHGLFSVIAGVADPSVEDILLSFQSGIVLLQLADFSISGFHLDVSTSTERVVLLHVLADFGIVGLHEVAVLHGEITVSLFEHVDGRFSGFAGVSDVVLQKAFIFLELLDTRLAITLGDNEKIDQIRKSSVVLLELVDSALENALGLRSGSLGKAELSWSPRDLVRAGVILAGVVPVVLLVEERLVGQLRFAGSNAVSQLGGGQVLFLVRI